jgi:8-oxo-dGTP pyrophosphatase MutT (NUDIX family)
VRAELESYAPGDPEQQRLRVELLRRVDDGAVHREARPDHLTVSAVVLDASRAHVLLVLHAKTGLWLQPGGHLEDRDATLSAGALREAVEETGVPDLQLVSTVPIHLERHAAPCGAEHHLDVRYLVLARDGATPIVSAESLDVQWSPVDELPDQPQVDLKALVAAALRA